MSTYYQDEGCTLYQGDCLDLLPLVADRSVDAVICDPPYGTTACAWDSVIPFAPMWAELKRIIKPKGAIVLFGSQPFTSALVMSNPCMFRYEWIMHKSHARGHLNAQRRPMNEHENILVFCEGQPCYNPQLQQKRPENVRPVSRRAQSDCYGAYSDQAIRTIPLDMTYPRSVLETKRPDHDEWGLHPTQKPVALLEYLVKTYTHPGDTVLDFCFGSGTTAVACQKLGRRFIGMEQEEAYCQIAVERLCPPIAQEVLL